MHRQHNRGGCEMMAVLVVRMGTGWDIRIQQLLPIRNERDSTNLLLNQSEWKHSKIEYNVNWLRKVPPILPQQSGVTRNEISTYTSLSGWFSSAKIYPKRFKLMKSEYRGNIYISSTFQMISSNRSVQCKYKFTTNGLDFEYQFFWIFDCNNRLQPKNSRSLSYAPIITIRDMRSKLSPFETELLANTYLQLLSISYRFYFIQTHILPIL